MLILKKIKRELPTKVIETEYPVNYEYIPPWYEWELYEDGVIVAGVIVDEDGQNITAKTSSACKQLAKYKSNEFPTKNLNLALHNLEEFGCFSLSALVTKIVDKENIHFISQIREGIVFTLNVNLFKWEYSFSFDIYKDLFLENLNKNGFKKTDYGTVYGLPLIHFELDSNLPSEISIGNYISDYISKIRKSHQQTITEITSKLQNDTLLTFFNFPEEIKTSCAQYLLYFAEFLKDLGINATTNLKEDAGKILFSVIPTDDIEALDKIREALALYLNLPSSPIVYDDSFAAMRMQQQIENLQHSQKMKERELQLTKKFLIVQSETIREKNIIISQKDSIIEQQNKVIEKITSKSIMIDSLENKEELEICDGLKIGESKFLKEQLGIHFNPAKVIKTGVNKLFGKGDEVISILDSDEETEKNS